MTDVKTHYDNLLSPYYAWIFGGVEQKLEENRLFFREHGINPKGSGNAVDLGAGCGFQSIPLAEAGFRVTAIDTCPALLADLHKAAGQLPIKTIEDNLLEFRNHLLESVELIVCMGDTLTHLETRDDVRRLFKDAYQSLSDAGMLMLTFRDLRFELKGLERFIPVRSEPDLIFTCFLEYEAEHVKVHDVIYEKSDNAWQLKKGYYRKLRIPPDWARNRLHETGFNLEKFDIRDGMVIVIARKNETP
jgi:SAM-dependent methyltransferase